jgi:hypothetical protein
MQCENSLTFLHVWSHWTYSVTTVSIGLWVRTQNCLNNYGVSVAVIASFLLSEAQPKNALVTPSPHNWKWMQKFKRAHAYIRTQGKHTMLHFYMKFYSVWTEFYVIYNFRIQ